MQGIDGSWGSEYSFLFHRGGRQSVSYTHLDVYKRQGVYKARERIHRAMADARLLANPASRSRVADFDPN